MVRMVNYIVCLLFSFLLFSFLVCGYKYISPSITWSHSWWYDIKWDHEGSVVVLPKSGIGMRENPRLFNPSYVDFPVGSLNKGWLSYVRVNNAMLEIGAPPNPGIDSFKKVLNKLSRLAWVDAGPSSSDAQIPVWSLLSSRYMYLLKLTYCSPPKNKCIRHFGRWWWIGTILQWSWPCAKKDNGSFVAL